MSDRAWAIIGVVLACAGILIMAIGGAFFQQHQEAFWLGILVIGIIAVLLSLPIILLKHWETFAIRTFLNMNIENPSEKLKTFLIQNEQHFLDQFNHISKILLKLRQVRFVDNFGEYCDACKEMLSKSTSDDKILTLQTPVSLGPGAINEIERRKYDEYIRATIDKIISTDIEYRRLVVLKDSNEEPESKIKDFVKTLITMAVAAEQMQSKGFDLTNTFIGFVLLSSFPDLIYSNIDIHITTERDFSVAFLSRTRIRALQFGGSLHLHDLQRIVSRHLREDLEAIWDEILKSRHFIELANFYPAYRDGGAAKTDEEKGGILKEVSEKINAIVAEVKGKTAPDIKAS